MAFASDLDDVQGAIVDALEGVTGIGNVHAYVRRIDAESQLRAVAKPAGESTIRFWMVTRGATEEIPLDASAQTFEQRHTFEINGWASFVDASASETAFQALVEAVRAALRADLHLGFENVVVTRHAVVVDVEMLCPPDGPLCNHARLTVAVSHFTALGA